MEKVRVLNFWSRSSQHINSSSKFLLTIFYLSALPMEIFTWEFWEIDQWLRTLNAFVEESCPVSSTSIISHNQSLISFLGYTMPSSGFWGTWAHLWFTNIYALKIVIHMKRKKGWYKKRRGKGRKEGKYGEERKERRKENDNLLRKYLAVTLNCAKQNIRDQDNHPVSSSPLTHKLPLKDYSVTHSLSLGIHA